MTDVTFTDHEGRRADGGRAVRPASRWRFVPAVALTAVIGVLVGRFAFLDPAPPTETVFVTVNPSPAAQLAALEARLEVRPDDLDALQRIGVVAVTEGIESGDLTLFARADAAIATAEQLAPEAFATRYARASLALTLHRFDEALEHGRVAVAANPFSAEALGVVVDAQVELGLYDAAAADLQRMLDLDPGLPALARTSYLRELHGDLPGALQAMQQAEAAGAPSGFRTAVTAALVGDLHLRLGQVDDAEGAYARAEAASPGLIAAALGAIRVDVARGDLAGATEAAATLVKSGPSAVTATLLADLLRLQGRTAEAERSEAVVRANFADEEAVGHLTELDRARFEADRAADAAGAARAADLARIAHGIRPENVLANDTLAWALTLAGDQTAVADHARAAIRLGPVDPTFLVHAAAALHASGDDAEATTMLARALEEAPWFSLSALRPAQDLAAALGVAVPDAWQL